MMTYKVAMRQPPHPGRVAMEVQPPCLGNMAMGVQPPCLGSMAVGVQPPCLGGAGQATAEAQKRRMLF